ncbi:MAG: M28 family metallopeptidase, partial [Dehalococcoidia bacterium]
GGEETSIPVISVALSEREALQAAIGEQVTVVADAGVRTKTSQNVVGRTSEPCVAYLGAHYDSVAAGPGANDNASGTAVLLELARVHRTEGLCAIAFGAEEVGLFGSRDYVDQHLVGTARFMLNIDMAGRLDGPVIVGDRDLARSILDAVEAAGVDTPLRPGSFPPFASSDHVSFEAVGVPAVTFNSGDDDAIHTAEDTVDRVSLEALDVFLDATDAALAALMPERAPATTR